MGLLTRVFVHDGPGTGARPSVTVAPVIDPLPAGTHLLHIGPQKTGSTAVQSAMHASREQLREHGVIYPGPALKPTRAIGAGLGFGMGRGAVPPRPAEWETLKRQIADIGDQRVCISYENFGRLTGGAVRRVVEELGGARPHVVTVARRYDRLLPSQWQQRIKAGKHWSYDDWLRAVLEAGPPGSADPHGVWVPHDTVSLVRRWADVVGAEHLTVVVKSEQDPRQLLAVMEALLGVPDGVLRTEDTRANRSMSYQEVELVRAVNIALADVPHDDVDWHTLFSRGLIPTLVDRPFPAGEDRVPPVPAWAADLLEELSARRIEGLRGLGVRVIGDLEDLRTPAAGSADDAAVPPPVTVPIDTAVQAILGVTAGAIRRQRGPETSSDPEADPDGRSPERGSPAETRPRRRGRPGVLERVLGRQRRTLSGDGD